MGDKKAESEEDIKPEDIKQDSPLTHTGSMIRKTVVRTFSTIIGKKKRGETESHSSPSPNTNLSSGTPDSSATEDGFFHKFSSFRKSLSRNRRKSGPEIFMSNDTPEPQRTTEKTSDFILNIPSKPLSVLQIDELLKSDCLEDAYLNLLSLRMEFQHEQKALGEGARPAGLHNKEKDLNLLYTSLRKRLIDIVRHSCDPGSKQQLVLVAKIIEEEEEREGDLGGMKGWREAWKDAVQEGMKDTIKGVHLETHKQNVSWLAVHLGLLGKAIVEQLEKVKTELVSLYPPSFNVFETYISSCHEVLGEHLKGLLEKVTELKDYYAMLDFIINIYHSEKILYSPSLQPEMKEQKILPVPVDFLDQIKNKYCTCLQEKLRAYLDNIIKLEQEEMWKNKTTPKRTEDGLFLTANIDMDIRTMIGTFVENSEKIDGNLKNKVLCRCLEALKPFPIRFEEEFTKSISSLLSSDLLDCCLWAEYHTAYINSFSSLKKHMEVYSGSCPDEVKQLGSEVDKLVFRLREILLQQFIGEIQPFKEGLMTKNWLNTDGDFKEIINRLETYSGCGKFMRPPDSQFFANDMHYHVVKEYVSELLKKKYSCKGRKNDLAAAKIRDQWDELKKLFGEMGSTLDWLHPLGGQLSEIIEQENEKEIKKLIPSLIKNYPDISKKQLSAILYFRDSGVIIQWNQVTKSLSELKRNSGKTENVGNHEHILFSDIKLSQYPH